MRAIRLAMFATLIVAGATFAEPTTRPATQPAKRNVRLVQPWSKITDLSDDQKSQIIAIHADFTQRINRLRAEENERCLSVLSEDQKAALEALLAREAAERKARSATARQTTKPSADH
jgi:hypothetical protein